MNRFRRGFQKLISRTPVEAPQGQTLSEDSRGPVDYGTYSIRVPEKSAVVTSFVVPSYFSQGLSAGDVPLPDPPVAKKTGSFPSYVKSARTSADTFLPLDDPLLGITDPAAIRQTALNTQDLFRKFNRSSPDMSAATFTGSRMCVTKYTVLGRNLDGTLNEEGTETAQQLCRRFDLTGLAKGFNDLPSIAATAESLSQELLLFGGMSVELLLDKARLPEGLRPIAVDSIKFKYKDNRRIPYQTVGGVEISLDYPTFFYASLDQDLTIPYAASPMQSGLQPVQANQTFVTDLRRVMKRAVHPRVMALIDDDKWRKTVPSHILHDPDKLKAFANDTLTSIQLVLDGLLPESALVSFDSVAFSYLTSKSSNVSNEYKVLSAIQNSKVASGTKAPGVVLGHESAASQSAASAQTMLGVKTYASVQRRLNEIFSRLLTVAVRLYGVDCVVEFTFNDVDLRPEGELEAYRSMKQSRVLNQLSLGLITDQEAAIMLTGSLPPPGAPALSGTFFMTPAQELIENPDSQTSTMGKGLEPDTPAAPKTASGA